MRPKPPPVELRARVLLAAREAAVRQAPGLLEALYRDRLLRWCAATLAALAIADGLFAGGGAAQLAAPPSAWAADDLAIPADSGLTAAEQWDDLAPVLGKSIPGRRG